MKTASAVCRSLLEELREFETALLANTIGYVDPAPADEWYMGGSIQSVTPGLGPVAGIAYTCELDSSTPGGQASLDQYWEQLEGMEREEAPVIWVVKTTGSRPDHECVLGDGMAKSLYAAGCVGVVTDGGVRDVEGLRTVPFAAWARGRTVHHCALRFQGANRPVEIGGITVHPGDVIHAGADGVLKIPPSCVSGLPAHALRMQAFEREAHVYLRRGDLPHAEKRRRVQELLAQYSFAPR
jgi:regulator of RNase E activity RraA